MPETLTYTVNNKIIPLEIVELTNFDEVPIFDELNNYVTTRITAQWKTIFNVGATSAKYQGAGAGGTIVVGPNNLPVVTEQAIAWHLQQPRGQLEWKIADQVQLESPLPGFTVDSKNGPVPKLFSVNKILGTRSYEIVWGITTHQTRAAKFSNAPPILLSNVWSMTETLSANSYRSVRVSEGRATFDTARLPAGVSVDAYRPYVLPVCPRGFVRSVQVTITADGSQLVWNTTDVQQRVRLETPDVVKVTVQHSADLIVPSVVNQITAVAGAITSAAGALGAGIRGANPDAGGSRGSNLGSLAGGAAQGTLAFTQQISAALPCITYSVNVRVWGSTHASMFTLQQKALQIANYHLRRADIVDQGSIYAKSGLHILHDPEQGIVEVGLSVQTPARADAAVTLPTFMAGNPNGFVPGGGVVAGDWAPALTDTPAAQPLAAYGASVPPIGAGGGGGTNCRGYFRGQIFAQALQGLAERPAAPRLPTLPIAQPTPNR